MADGIDDNTIFLQVAALQRLNLTELRNKWVEKWVELFDNEPPPYNKKFLLKRLAYRLQELYFGGLSEPIKKKLEEISDNSGRKSRGTTKPVVGTKLIREHYGVEHVVTVLQDGYEYRGCKYDNLSAIARKITGTRWSGPAYFGLKK